MRGESLGVRLSTFLKAGDLVVPFGASSMAVPLLNSPPDARKLSDSYIKHNFVLFTLP